MVNFKRLTECLSLYDGQIIYVKFLSFLCMYRYKQVLYIQLAADRVSQNHQNA